MSGIEDLSKSYSTDWTFINQQEVDVSTTFYMGMHNYLGTGFVIILVNIVCRCLNDRLRYFHYIFLILWLYLASE